MKKILLLCLVTWASLWFQEPNASGQTFSDLPNKPAPAQISSVTNVGTSGGTALIFGSGFTSTTQVQICKVPCTTWVKPNPPMVYLTSTEIEAVVPPLPAGNYNLVLSDLSGFVTSSPAVLVVTTTTDPLACAAVFSPNSVIGWYRPDSISGATWVDRSTFAQNLVVTGAPTVAPDANFNNEPALSLTGDGSQYALASSGWSLEGGTTLWMFMVSRNTGGAFPCVAAYNGGGPLTTYFRNTGQIPNVFENSSGTNASWGVSEANNPIGWYGYASSLNSLVGVLVGIGPAEVNSAGSFTLGISGGFSIGIDVALNADDAFEGEIADVVAINVDASTVSGYYACLYNYANFRYALDAPPTIEGVTAINPDGGPFRVHGTNFSQGGSITTLGSTVNSTFLSTAAVQADTADSGYAPGQYNVTVTNADSFQITATNALTVATVLDPWGILGESVIQWFRADQFASPDEVPVTGSLVSGWPDLSQLGNDLDQPTSINQPTWNASNTDFGGQPSIDFAGSQWLFNSNLDNLTPTSLYVWVVYNQKTSTGGDISKSSAMEEDRTSAKSALVQQTLQTGYSEASLR